MPELIICEVADAFLDELYATDEASAAFMDVVLQELSGDQECLATLHLDVPKWVFHLSLTFEFKRFGEAWALKRRIYILKPRDDQGHHLDYRMLVAHDTRDDNYYILRVAHRKDAYDPTSQEFAELIAAYDERGIPPVF